MKPVRTRFAPSPTGFLHIGGFRTALYAWLLARGSGGSFILRIEDTDRERKVDGAVQYILEGFQWFGIDIDEGPTKEQMATIGESYADMPDLGGEYGPYVQSLRLARYQEVADQLVAEGHAFRCDCTPEMLDRERAEQRARREVPGYSGYCRTRNVSKDTPHVVRFKMPHRPEVTIVDGIRGRIQWDSVPLRDPILQKSDGFPTYHLAVVVDDHDMEITHVLRGEEWIPSTPLHVLVYRALGWNTPVFCHLPVVLGSDGKKLSKRHGATAWSAFREQGYVPEALLNFVARIGWSPGGGDEQEIFSRQELIEKFSLDRVNASGGVFEYNKLEWMNGIYIREISDDRLDELVAPFFQAAAVELTSEQWSKVRPLIKDRVKLLSEIPEMVRFLEDKPLHRDMDQMSWKGGTLSDLIPVFEVVAQALSSLPTFTRQSIEGALDGVVSSLGLKKGQVLLPVRIAVLGRKATPPLAESLEVLGVGRTLDRLTEVLEHMKNAG